MTYRKLLELAAKAAGVNVSWFQEDGGIATGNGNWNPLTDDGDALRLAVKLNMTGGVGIARTDIGEATEFELCNVDPYAATRRAIVRAAAEIGKDMK